MVKWYLEVDTNCNVKIFHSCILTLYNTIVTFIHSNLIHPNSQVKCKQFQLNCINTCIIMLETYSIGFVYGSIEMESFFIILSLCIEIEEFNSKNEIQHDFDIYNKLIKLLSCILHTPSFVIHIDINKYSIESERIKQLAIEHNLIQCLGKSISDNIFDRLPFFSDEQNKTFRI